MYRRSFTGLLLRPSPLSSVVCSIFVIATLTTANWSFIHKTIPFYEYFFGPEGLVTTLQNSQGSGAAIGHALTGKSLGHNVEILGGALIAGLAAYVAVRIIVRMIGGISMTLREIQAVDTPAKHEVEHQMVRRAGIRGLVALVWLAYLFLFLKVIVPFCVFASKVGLDEKNQLTDGIGYVFFAVCVLSLSTHLHVVLARLFLLRPRVFGSEEVVLTR